MPLKKVNRVMAEATKYRKNRSLYTLDSSRYARMNENPHPAIIDVYTYSHSAATPAILQTHTTTTGS